MKRAMYAVIVLWAVLTAVYMTNMGRADKVSISTAFTDSVDGEEWCELDTYIGLRKIRRMLSHTGGEGKAGREYSVGAWNNIIVWAGNGMRG